MKSILSNTMQSYDVFFNPAILVPKNLQNFHEIDVCQRFLCFMT